MTTQNTHFEHNDVDATVVERQLAPENLEKLAETAQPAEATSTDANSTSTSVSAHVKIGLEQSVAQEEGKTPSVHEHGGATGQSVQANGNEQSETTQVISAQAVEAPALKFNQLPLASMEEEVRPFTDFIAEFRQAEARLNASVQHSEVFTLLTPAAEEGASPEEPVIRPETTQGGLVEAVTPIIAGQPAQEEKLQTPEVESQQSSVSPLLRPASRLRLPRHGTRHQPRESTPDAETKQKLSLVTEPVISASVTPASAEVADETPAEVEKPRPTRRYRFDRPSANKAAPAVPVVTPTRIEENRSASTNNREAQEPAIETAVKAPAPVVSISEILAVKPVVLQEESIAEPVVHGRRQKQQERTKEQPAALQQPAVPVTEVTPAVQESPKVEEIAPEDLPPLEYAELQKATNSRRRRRHRSSPTPNANNNNDTAATVVPTPVQAAPVAPARPVSPASPISPAASQSSQYSIVSGYTVSQMNQGNDMSGPFMAPEPSPARGSLISREVRSPRAEILRSPAPTYPIRSNPQEGTLNTTVLNQFANVIGQAIQAQTDRMVTELRRVTQAPTNVTVSLPPFPSNERVGVFVDVANLLYSARTLRIGVDFGKLLDFLRGNRRLIRAQAYCPTSPQPGDEQMFLQAVKGLGYRITTKNYKTFSSGAKKADLDLDLCMDVVRLVDGKAVDCIVLVSGDSDFMPMLDYCSDHGVRVEVAAFDEAMSATLRQSCDLFVNLSQLEEIRA